MTDGVLVVGEALVDIVKRQDGSTETFPGGSAANVAVASPGSVATPAS